MKQLLILVLIVCSYTGSAWGASGNGGASQIPAAADAFQRGLTALKENRLDDALAELTTAEREHPNDPRVHNFRGILLARLGKNAEAASEYQAAIRIDPRMEDAYRNLGFLQWSEHQLDPARESLEHALQLSPGDSFAHYYFGRVEMDTEHYERAFHELEISRQPLPSDPGFLIQAAKGYIATRRTQDAHAALAQLATAPLSDVQSIQVASLLLSVHESDSAIALIKKINNGHSSDHLALDHPIWAQFDLALADLLGGNYEYAVQDARPCTESPGSTPLQRAQAWSLLGIAYSHLHRSDPAIDAFSQAAKLAPNEEEHWLNLTHELMELKRYPEAIKAVQSGLSAIPNSYALHLRLGAACLAAGRYADAEAAFRTLVTAGDPLPTSYIGLAQVLLRTGRAEEAARELGDAEKKIGPSFLISYFRGLALDRAGDAPQALDAFRAAVHLNPDSSEAHLNLGKLELGQGHAQEAIAELQTTLRLDPDNQQGKRLLSQAYRRAGDAMNAAKFAEASTTNPAAPDDNLAGDFIVPQWQPPPSPPAR